MKNDDQPEWKFLNEIGKVIWLLQAGFIRNLTPSELRYSFDIFGIMRAPA